MAKSKEAPVGVIVTPVVEPSEQEGISKRAPYITRDTTRRIGQWQSSKQQKETALSNRTSERDEVAAILKRRFQIVLVDEATGTTRQDKLDSADVEYYRTKLVELDLEIDKLKSEIADLKAKIIDYSTRKREALTHQRNQFRKDRTVSEVKDKAVNGILEASKNGGRQSLLDIQGQIKSNKEVDAKNSIQSFLGQHLNFSKRSMKVIEENSDLVDSLLQKVEQMELVSA